MNPPAWLRRGVTPHGNEMTVKERALLRVLCHYADDDGWNSHSSEFLAYHAKIHRVTVTRHLKRFHAWGLVVPDARLVLGKTRKGWTVLAHKLAPIIREKVVTIDGAREHQRLKITIRALEHRIRELEELTRLARVPLVTTAESDAAEYARRFAAGLGMARVHFVEVGGERIYGEPSQLRLLVDAGVSSEINAEPLWPTEEIAGVRQGVVPLARLADAVAVRLKSATEAEIEETLRWYRADLWRHPEQIRWFGSHTFTKPDVWLGAVSRGFSAQREHEAALLRALTKPATAPPADHASVVLQFEGHTEMSVSDASERSHERQAILARGLWGGMAREA